MAADGNAGVQLFQPLDHLRRESHVQSFEQYLAMYKRSVEDPEGFWSEIAQQFYWKRPPTGMFLDYNFDCRKGRIYIKWMEGAQTNICYNAVDRHVKEGRGNKVAFYWEGNDPDDHGKITFQELLERVCKFANVLKKLGLKKGDRVAIYMPMILELSVAMLACARIGIVHSIVFAGFSSESLAERILDAQCSAVLTADGVWRGTKLMNLKKIVDDALIICEKAGHKVKKCVVVKHLTTTEEMDGHGDTEDDIPAKRPVRKLKVHFDHERDVWWHDEMAESSSECEPEWMDAEDQLFMLYTSGSTGKPKGVLHTVAGYMLYAATTFKYDFDYQENDIYWCTADVGWITGHTYVCYGPLTNGSTSVIFEGTPFYPDPGRFWSIVEKYEVTKFYTAPTAIRALMKFGDEFVTKYNRSSLKVLATVGEPINPEAWLWYYNVVGQKQCAIVDTFWLAD
ncbi:acetyl-coenzyme A synthetase, cytoplasmic-like [Argopecten irradians]|uniref:acetyl-coenzyme A synthetase, cytoplasmic-like n=1 Tax=Argopecten irradians TaxID=31199 RepID=UPI003719B8A2